MSSKRHERGALKEHNPAEIYNQKRRIVFSEFEKNPENAKEWLEKYRSVLGEAGYAGLKAELEFYERFRRDYKLVVGLDAADHTDFAAVIDRVPHRIDVTTNLAFKKLQNYQPLQSEGDLYKIAYFDGTNFELFDINYPFCPDCQVGRILPTGMLLGVNMDTEGNSNWSNDQLLVNICSACDKIEVVDRITTPFLYDFEYVYESLNEANLAAHDAGNTLLDVKGEASAYAHRASRFLSERFGERLVGVGSKFYTITDTRGGGQWTFSLVDRLPLVADLLKNDYVWDLALG